MPQSFMKPRLSWVYHSYSDLEININVHSKALAAGTKFSNSLHIIWLCVLSIMLLPLGLVWSY